MLKRYAILGATAAALGALALTAGQASAATTAASPGWIAHDTTAYVSPSNQTAPTDTNLRAGTEIQVLCFTEGQRLHDNPYWFRIAKNEGGPSSGFVHRSALGGVGTNVPHC